jgi:hypothetical protein
VEPTSWTSISCGPLQNSWHSAASLGCTVRSEEGTSFVVAGRSGVLEDSILPWPCSSSSPVMSLDLVPAGDVLEICSNSSRLEVNTSLGIFFGKE